MAKLKLNPKRTALLIQDLQNDVIIEKGAFADSGSPQHAKEQNVVANVQKLAAAFRRAKASGDPRLVHRREGRARPEAERAALRGRQGHERARPRHLGREAGEGPRAEAGRLRRREDAMSAWQDTKLETLLAGLGVDTVVVSGAWTNMSIEHTARTGADKGYYMLVPEDCCSTMNADWHNASINYALQNVSTVTDGKSVAAALGLSDAGRR